ncbi:MAG TPA: SDR family NAD(P)-dependent oxidoreductase [Spirochaetia bacterium]|nr:SDR family NAD(P)-dependent oxidoreductase [Spirochaetia bacterium]
MTVLITGASAGIGEACARAFAARGYHLVLGARRLDRIEALAAELAGAHGILVTTVFLDARDRASAESILTRAGNPEIDVLINNAGLARGLEPLQNNKADDWDEMIDTNVKGLLWVTQPVIRQMIGRIEAHPGTRTHVVNLGSLAGIQAYPNGAVYCATKAAVKSITDGLRQDVNAYPIRVTLIQPGMVETEFSQVRFRGDEARAKAVYRGIEPLTAADIADLAVYAVSAPGHVQITELTVTATHQANAFTVHRQ